VVSCVSGVARGRMGVMGRLLVVASFVVLGSFTVMAGCVAMMLRSLLVMLRRFFGHWGSPWVGLVAPALSAGIEASSASAAGGPGRVECTRTQPLENPSQCRN
jgi:hypothetical protein